MQFGNLDKHRIFGYSWSEDENTDEKPKTGYDWAAFWVVSGVKWDDHYSKFGAYFYLYDHTH